MSPVINPYQTGGRVYIELKDIYKDNNLRKNKWFVEQIGDSRQHLIGRIVGPEDTPYENGVYKIDILIPETYPWNPPNCKFITKLWHPNISPVTGDINGLDILKFKWSLEMTCVKVLQELRLLLSKPQPDNPEDKVVSKQYKTKHDMFVKTAKYWNLLYGFDEDERELMDMKDFADYDEKVEKLMKDKNLKRRQALEKLSYNYWDLDKAQKCVV